MLFFKILIAINKQDKSTTINTQLDSLIPASKISGLTQGMFIGSVSDDFDERMEQKIFHCEIVVDNAKVSAETKAYQKIPEFTNFITESGENVMQQEIEKNYFRIKEEAQQIVDWRFSVYNISSLNLSRILNILILSAISCFFEFERFELKSFLYVNCPR